MLVSIESFGVLYFIDRNIIIISECYPLTSFSKKIKNFYTSVAC
jgi:hypothetical protein